MKRGFAAQFGERLKFLSPQQATGYFGIFTTAHRAVVPHFRFKKDLILYLNSSRAASSGEFKFKNWPFTAPQFWQHWEMDIYILYFVQFNLRNFRDVGERLKIEGYWINMNSGKSWKVNKNIL